MKKIMVVAFFCISNMAAAAVTQCPNEITTRQSSTANSGWSLSKSQHRNFLTGARFSLGNPELLMAQTAVDYKESDGTIEHTYRFDPKGKSIWVVCDYNATSIVLTREIGRLSECKVKKNKVDSSVRFTCSR